MRRKFTVFRLQLTVIGFFVVIFLTFVFLYPIPYTLYPSHAQSLNLTNTYNVSDKDAQDGDILIFDPTQGIMRTNLPYDIHVFGVLEKFPTLVLKSVDNTGEPVARSGVTDVNVTNVNGPIKAGDYITTSEVKGFGMKASQSGYSLGIALKDFDESKASDLNNNGKSLKAGKVPTAIRVEFAELTNPRSTNRIFEAIGTAFFRNSQDPQGFGQIIKYVTAGIVMIMSLVSGMFILSKSMPKAIEALGRNPLARRSIQISMVISIIMVVFIVAVGMVSGLIILRL